MLRTFCLLIVVGWPLLSAADANLAATLTAPEFACDLPKFRQSGDGTNQVRQLRKIQRKLERCIDDYKSKLVVQRETIVKIQEGTTNKALLAQIEEALLVIDHILQADLIPEVKGTKPTQQDFGGELQHGGGR